MRGHKQELRDRFTELKTDFNHRFQQFEEIILDIRRPENEYRTDIKQQERRIHWLERDLAQAFDRIEALEKSAQP
jgi:predicted RNase H-like nuclease (RuvC/YqgF family)